MNRIKEKLHKFKDKWKQSQGALIMESAFVYPIMFFVVFFMIFFGNMFCIRAGIDSLVAQEAIESAARYADPKLADFEAKVAAEDEIPASLSEAGRVTKNLYRYLDVFDLSGSQSTSTGSITEGEGTYTGFFSGMNADNIEVVKHHVNNYIVYQTYEVEVHYKLKFPWKFIFDDERIYIPMVARAEVPVTDSPEFIRNVDMAVDMLERSEGGEYFFANADTIYGKVRDFLNGESPTGDPVSGGTAIAGKTKKELQEIADKAAQDYNASRKGYEKAIAKGFVGVEKTPNGGPSFANSDYIYKKDGEKVIVTIKATGSRSQDFTAANKKMKEKFEIESKPEGYTWHHLDDYNVEKNEITLELVTTEAHKASYPHSGGCAQYKAVTGKTYK